MASIGVLLVLAASVASGTQTARSRNERFDAVVDGLHEAGRRVEAGRIVLWTRTADLSQARQQWLANEIAAGLDGAERLLGLSFGSGPLEYYVTTAFGPTCSYDARPPGRVFLALSRIQAGDTPYVHEAAHGLEFRYGLPMHQGSLFPTWAFEGFPSWVQGAVIHSDAPPPDNAMILSNENLDAEVERLLTSEEGQAVLPFVGRTGAPANINADRLHVARPFYLLSQSFVNHLVKAVGIRTFATDVVPTLRDADALDQAIRRLTGTSIETHRTAWLATLKSAARATP